MPNSPYASVALIAVLVLLMYFVVLRPQRKRQQQQQQALSAIEPGTRVMLTSGIFATVVAVGQKQMVVETAPGQRLTILKQAMSRAVPAGDEDAPDVLNQNSGPVTGAAAGTAAGEGAGSGEPTADGAWSTDSSYTGPTYTDVPVEQAPSGETVWPPQTSAAGRSYPDDATTTGSDAGRDEAWSAGPPATWSAGTEAADQAAAPQNSSGSHSSTGPDGGTDADGRPGSATNTSDSQSTRD